jgi:hypothetical protein
MGLKKHQDCPTCKRTTEFRLNGDIWLCCRCGKPADVMETWSPAVAVFILLVLVLLNVILKGCADSSYRLLGP